MATNVYYSLSPFGTGDLKVACNISIAGGAGAATFSVAQTGNIGIGDHVISSNIDGFISEMTDSTHATIVSALGVAHANQTSEALTSIAHEYDGASAFEAGFTDANHVNNTDLTAADVLVHACCYYDHDDQTPDSTVTWDFGTTDATRRVIMMTPNGGTESINIQRSETGIWDDNKYKVEHTTTGNSQGCIEFDENFMDAVGIQMKISGTHTFAIGLAINNIDAGNKIVVDKCIIWGNGSGASGFGIGSYDNDIIYEIKNCIIYGFSVATSYGIGGFRNTSTCFNTVVSGCDIGLFESGSGVITNCAFFNNADDISGSPTITYSAGDDADFDSGTGNIGWSSEATDWNANFTDYANKDFSVKDTDADIYNAGTNTGAPTTDIIGTARPQETTVDIGAFELVVAAGGSTGPQFNPLIGCFGGALGGPI